jgi:hypothetical protein
VAVPRGCRGVRGQAGHAIRRGGVVSGEELDARVGVEERVGGGPVVEDPHDLLAGAAYEPGRGVPKLPAQHFRFRDCEGPVEAAELEPTHEVRGERDDREAASSAPPLSAPSCVLACLECRPALRPAAALASVVLHFCLGNRRHTHLALQ